MTAPCRASRHPPSRPHSPLRAVPCCSDEADVAVLPRGCGGGANRRRAWRASAPARAARAAVEDPEGRQRCVRYCPPLPSTGGAWDSAGWTGTALGRPMRPLRVCGDHRCVYHLEPMRASTSRCGHRPCRASRRPAHLRTAPPCCPPALAIQTWGGGAIRGAVHGGSVYGGLCGRAYGELGGSRC